MQQAHTVGVLDCIKLGFYRRAAAPYEDKKIEIPATCKLQTMNP